MKNTARNKQIVFFADSRKTVKLKLFLEKAKKGHSGEFLDISSVNYIIKNDRHKVFKCGTLLFIKILQPIHFILKICF